MQIEQQGPDVLTVRHGAGAAIVMGLLFVVVGGWLSYSAYRDPGASTDGLRLVFGAVFVAGLWLLWGAQPARHRFDAGSGVASLTWRRLLAPSRREQVPFAQIADVEVRGSPASDDDRMWRAELVLHDARRLPLTPYWLSSRSAAEDAATSIRAVLARADQPAIASARGPRR